MLDSRAIGIERLPPLFNLTFEPELKPIQRDRDDGEVLPVIQIYETANDDRSNRNDKREAQFSLADEMLHILIEQQNG